MTNTDPLAQVPVACPAGHSAADVKSIRDGLQVRCTACGWRGPPQFYGHGGWPECRACAVAAWNARAPHPPNPPEPMGDSWRGCLSRIAWPVKDSADPRMSTATIADLRMALEHLATLEARP